ncbi:uncharacterized protein A4U43_UnF7480 [Asparagus officinalis]|uniref:Uncharacterized protein n=1 Tax=Asparagus officinalis TaxID=4686 RepID=A0A1R3L668_ASPOF|nr:uncharacterized protein A4U43_UnF7480 [Asparagus officinalis]
MKKIQAAADEVKECYDDIGDFTDEEFINMMLFDGYFHHHFMDSSGRITAPDGSKILKDLFLLENQLPFVMHDVLISLRGCEGIEMEKVAVQYVWDRSADCGSVQVAMCASSNHNFNLSILEYQKRLRLYSVKMMKHNSHPVPNYLNMVEIIVDSKSVFYHEIAGDSFFSHLKKGPQVGPSRGLMRFFTSSSQKSPKSNSNLLVLSPKSNSNLSARMFTDVISSLVQPPTFERSRSHHLRRRRRAPLSLGRKTYWRFLAGLGKASHTQLKKGQSNSSSSPCLSINALSLDSISSIVVNCRVIEPLPLEAFSDIKALKVERAKLIS